MAQFEISQDDMSLAAAHLSKSVMASLMYDGTHINGSPEAVAMVSALNFNDLRKAELLRYVAAKRYAKETGGIDINGMAVRTDRESQALINGAYNMAKEDEDFTTKFKSVNGFIELNAAQLIGVAVAVGAHVAACFAAEATAEAGVTSGSMTTRQHVDAVFNF